MSLHVSNNGDELDIHSAILKASASMKLLHEKISQIVNEKSKYESPMSTEDVTKDTGMENGEEKSENVKNDISLTNLNMHEIIEVYRDYLKTRKGKFEKCASLHELTKSANLNLEKHNSDFTYVKHNIDKHNVKEYKALTTSPFNSNYLLEAQKVSSMDVSKLYDSVDKYREMSSGEKLSSNSQLKLEKFVSKSFSEHLHNFANFKSQSCQSDVSTRNKGTNIKATCDNEKARELDILEVVSNKLDSIERLFLTNKSALVDMERENDELVRLKNAMKQMWTKLEDQKVEFDNKLINIYENDKNEKKSMRNSIISNHQSAVQALNRCANLEKQFFDKNNQICQFLQNNDSKFAFQQTEVGKFLGKHVDFLPVLLMLLMYLATLILKH